MLLVVSTFLGDRHIRATVRADNVKCAHLLKSLGFAAQHDTSGVKNDEEDIVMILDARALEDITEQTRSTLVYRDDTLCKRLVNSALLYVDELNK